LFTMKNKIIIISGLVLFITLISPPRLLGHSIKSDATTPLIVAASGSLVYFFTAWYYSPMKIFQRKFNFKLPKAAKVVNYKFSFWEDILIMKVSFDESEYGYIERKLEIYFKGAIKNNLEYVFSDHVYKGDCPWWEREENELITFYYITTTGKRGVKTKPVRVYITKSKNNQYYLYVHH